MRAPHKTLSYGCLCLLGHARTVEPGHKKEETGLIRREARSTRVVATVMTFGVR